MSTQTVSIEVAGMTCAHCVRSVQEELMALPGVTDVAVELVNGATSRATITATQPLDDGDVKAAVDEAGYAITSSHSLL
jgi:copper chaperone CopZ